MNTHARPATLLPAVGSAEAPARRRWTLAELEHMVAAGVIPESERIELIDGEVVAMSAKGRRHEIVRNELALAWSRRLPPELKLATETPLRLDPETAPEPDIIVFPAPLLAPDVNGDSVLLVVEISDSSVSYDLNVKSIVYAAFGVREYWVIDARSLVTTVHRRLNDKGYADICEIPGVDTITPLAAPSLATRLADLIGDKPQP
jgi:Uma2 family endonuclease